MTTLDQLLGDPANAAVWTLARERSTVAFTCRSFWGLLPVKGTFTELSGTGQLGNGTAFGRLDIDAASLTTGIGKRDDHLRSEDFFAVDRFPTISVVVTAVEPADGAGGGELRSTLTVRGVTRPISLPATVALLDDGAVQLSVNATIDRTEWDVSGNLLGMVKRPASLAATGVFVKIG
jgi:polyisoprenoid-binding protein YceI